MARTLNTYSLSELHDLEAQALNLLADIQREIANRQESCAATVCGYDADGGLLDAKTHHTFARVTRCGR